LKFAEPIWRNVHLCKMKIFFREKVLWIVLQDKVFSSFPRTDLQIEKRDIRRREVGGSASYDMEQISK
jgi:hypothetical protein